MSGASEGASTVLSVDTGGTFTDLVLLSGAALATLKLPSTPSDPAAAVLEGIRRLVPENTPFLLLHGSTVATNALLERKGARVSLITNRGFEDILEIGRQNRPQLYALTGYRLPPLVGRDDRIGVAGRVGPDGEEIEPLDAAELQGLAERLRSAESVAVCLLHSYANPSHEAAVAAALGDLTVPLSVSSDLIPEFREYERTSTTVVNAYVAPLMSRYLGRVASASRASRVAVMGSGGGTIPVERAASEPAHTVLSGPAGGVVGALTWARRAGHDHIITFDMGGTSTDVSLCPGRPLHTKEFTIAGQPVALPVIDIHTVGAGGGSIARVDKGGALRVGPESAGADPGPVAYGRGGEEITVTDAHVWLRRIPDYAFLGGERALHRDRVEEPLTRLASELGMGPDETAEGILDVADTAMEGALRVISVERGHDPAEFALLAFGGAGGLHVAELAARLGAARALIPPDPGLLSAYGMLAAPPEREASRTVLTSTDDARHSERITSALTELAESAVRSLVAEGAQAQQILLERWVDARYRGQSFELRVAAEEWVEAFHREHRTRYGYAREGTPVEAVTLRAIASAPGPSIEADRLATAGGPPPLATGLVRFRDSDHATAIAWRRDLFAGHVLDGPALVLEYSATTWIPPGWTLTVGEWGALHLLPG